MQSYTYQRVSPSLPLASHGIYRSLLESALRSLGLQLVSRVPRRSALDKGQGRSIYPRRVQARSLCNNRLHHSHETSLLHSIRSYFFSPSLRDHLFKNLWPSSFSLPPHQIFSTFVFPNKYPGSYFFKNENNNCKLCIIDNLRLLFLFAVRVSRNPCALLGRSPHRQSHLSLCWRSLRYHQKRHQLEYLSLDTK